MDKSWMHADRRSKAYEFGVEAFLNFAVENLLTTTHIRCPCVKCVNLKLFGVGIIRDHVYFNVVDQSYKNWTFHGEPREATTNASRNVEEYDGHSRYSFVSEEIDIDDNDFGDFGSDLYEFANVIGDGDQPMYPGCRKYMKLSALVMLVLSVGVPSSQKMGVSKPLSGCTNTEEVLPYIEQHMIHIKTAYPKFRKRTKWLQDKHNSTFIQWLRFKVQSELEEDNHGVSENLRWLAAGPNMAVPLYRSYLIKGIKFNIKAQDDVRTTQNSGVYLLAHTMQVASAKDKNPILSNMGFYGVIQEIWDLDYQKFTIPVFRCDWIDSSGLVVDELGFTLVDLSKIGHRNDQFVLASQVKQIFFVDDPMHRGWSVVLSMPNREYNDVIGDEVLGDVIIECEPFTRGMPNVDTFDELVGELGGQNIRDGCEDIWIE
ncbi:hypothetical protein L3X38_011272 [Prunus dulcis]|uniref:Transposable element protein n=1 Tax=Prunus dulcis TaxID=3755 RepID=A0AAD4WJK2_PRUDU|nr:hypothetical protein L3X38_011272 [Prunus dulcis]